MFCTNCGAENPERAKFCYKCGAHVAGAPLVATAPLPQGGSVLESTATVVSAISATKTVETTDLESAGTTNTAPAVAAPVISASHTPTSPPPAPTAPSGLPSAVAKPAATKPKLKRDNSLWPKVDTLAAARSAAQQGAAVCFLVAGVTGVIALIAVGTNQQVLGENGWSLLDAVIFAIAGWRTIRLSRAWSVAALLLYMVEAGFRLSQGSTGAIVVMIFFIMGLINGIRGVFAHHRLATTQPK